MTEKKLRKKKPAQPKKTERRTSNVKPWSISTTVRNPERLRGFLGVLTQMEGDDWHHNAQRRFQIMLIQARLYGAFNVQFYKGLSGKDIKLLEDDKDISYSEAARIFNKKNYEDEPMRGRNSFKPLQKFGFADIIGRKVVITEMGREFLAEENDYGDIFLRVLLKWQLPNSLDSAGFPASHGYDIKPFVGTLRLIHEVNRLCRKNGMTEKGLSFHEFKIFAPTLIDWRRIENTAQDIVNLRKEISKKPADKREAFFDTESRRMRASFHLKHVADYADNIIRYFRMTKYIHLRGWGDHIDLEPSRKYEIESLFNRDSAAPITFTDSSGYPSYLADRNLPDLPGESKIELRKTITWLRDNIVAIGGTVSALPSPTATVKELKIVRDDLREQRRNLVNQTEKSNLKNPDETQKCADDLRSLLKREKGRKKSATALEWNTARGLWALNDALEIKPNCPLGDDNTPAYTAPAGKADIECDYGDFAAICEVTLLTDGKQWVHEAQPVMRHLHDFQKANKNTEVFCIFIAPSLHKDTINTFYVAAKIGYESVLQKIAPFSLEHFCQILDFARKGKQTKSRSHATK